jgi:hypothetical protein
MLDKEHRKFHALARRHPGEDGRSIKRCPRCGELKAWCEFWIRADGKPTSLCRKCAPAARREYYRRQRYAQQAVTA